MPIQRTRREQLCIAFNDIAFFHYYPCSLFFCIICCCSILNDYGYVQISTASASFLFLNYHNVPKCLTIHIPQETEISIHYNFPDLVRLGTEVSGTDIDLSNKGTKKQALPKQSTQYLDQDAGVVGIDAMWSRRQQQLQGTMVGGIIGTHQEKQLYDTDTQIRDLNTFWERHKDMKIQQQHLGSNLAEGDESIHLLPSKGEDSGEESDISILVYQTIETMESPSTLIAPKDDKQKKNRPNRHGIERYYIQETKGRITYTTSTTPGSVHICVQSKKASPQYPSRAGIDVQYDFYRKQPQQLLMSLADTLTFMGKDQVPTMLKEADYAKTIEVAFHAQSIKFSGDIIRYSIVRILCLLLIAIVQLQLLMHFFNTKRLT